MTIPGRVCNCRDELGKVNVGIAFVNTEEQVNQLLEQLFIIAGTL